MYILSPYGPKAINFSLFTFHSIPLFFPGNYLSVMSCYYQVLVDVPRPPWQEAYSWTRATGMCTARTPVDAKTA